jgi:uncharacterized protein YodC (DUF2158 family)
MSEAFKVGDTVALKSGGHPMTVSSLDMEPPPTGGCHWFDESGRKWESMFLLETLAPITRKAVHLDEVTIRHIWVFADTGEPIADHIAYRGGIAI